ncbi:putative oxidoreductase [Lentithecium fluviatile CBS 122367]|uniref:Putative oxidoreductase n=1 Tax=Lentithecium fluviatile CBS 122367 TaxID=1168545 RepID=A0A6G1IKE2_9PLEO|nr:putative oxidoreductase [Lentithecium fluviatile CBS 122367]
MSLAGKVALITGASKGIGRAIALRLGKDGASIAAGYGTDAEGAQEVVDHIGAKRARAFQADVAVVADLERLVTQTIDAFGKIDVLIPAAGIMAPSPLEATSEELFDRMFATNVKHPMFLCQKAVPHMAVGSHIVLISTTLTAASTVMPPYLPYVSSKGAIEQMTRVLSKDLGRKGINVNCVAPGPTSTKLFMTHQTEQSLKMLSSLNPNGRIGEPEEVADTIAFLCSNESRWVMGQTLRVNGGMA